MLKTGLVVPLAGMASNLYLSGAGAVLPCPWDLGTQKLFLGLKKYSVYEFATQNISWVSDHILGLSNRERRCWPMAPPSPARSA